MINAIFFAFFDVDEGPKVLHQVPPSSVHPSPSPNADTAPLVSFPSLSQYLIPAPTLSNRPLQLLTPTKPHLRLLSYPVTISSHSYPRNAFTFNFILVLPEDIGFHTYLPVSSKLASLFRHLEEQERFLSTEIQLNPTRNSGRIYAICEQVLEDLNNYSECMIPIDGTTTTINIKLFPVYASPPPIQAWHVPLLVVDVNGMRDESWDLTLLRILPFIDGVRSVKRIALEADADFKLVKKALKHLLYYGCLNILDIFSFSAVYAPTESISNFIDDEVLQSECLSHVPIAPLAGPSKSASQPTHAHHAHQPADSASDESLTAAQLFELYTSLTQGKSLRSWVLEQDPQLPKRIDLRRFITFGITKGFLYRVHKYPIAISAIPTNRKGKGLTKAALGGREGTTANNGKGSGGGAVGRQTQADLGKFLDGTHCFDEICTELMISEKELMVRLKVWDGDVQVIHR